ncbi:NADP-dependent oxidoreductase [Coraliomargarita sp. SDUM461003]|uniref:NADP-dependent oxidoreductase n=1 Tax=Thalassobacterium maritimum TaxID=3041265 RepID=A0ABU1ARD9_9BACT|nr:NADP-dependent oxidoreductase [Coraliomargarita sp. SDUM461003]MDQ8206725.1 NADP-dependent oxidoreductase [Coraliomargarita sp. SDUM461003]
MSESNSYEIHLKSRPDGMPTQANFECVAVPIPEAGEGEFLVKNEWMSVDPYMRGRMKDADSYVPPFALGEVMEGGCVGRILHSNHSDFSEGDYVLSNQGWRDHWVGNGQGVLKVDIDQAPASSYLSVLGMTGMTAYVGLLEIGALKAGETVFVSAASGAVGSIVCQIAKIKGCRVIASSGSKSKIEWLKQKAGVDEAINYREVDDLSAKLRELCPDGIDVYFDNVGGDHLEAAIDQMNEFGRIACCGAISGYNDTNPSPGPSNLFKIIGKRLRVQGFIVRDHQALQPQFAKDMSEWIQSGKITWEETVSEGIENAPQAFISLFEGDKMGKALVKL